MMINDFLVQLFLIVIPECLLLILTLYIIAKKPLNIKKIVISAIFMTIISSIVFRMPLSYGVHTIILSITYVSMSILYHKIEVKKSISSYLTALAITMLLESAGILFLVNIAGIPVNTSESGKIILSILSKITYAAVIYIFYNIYYVKNAGK
ncbi:MAG: hypothetical protein ABRQ27_02790 [Clostridiaceae bacterium]